MAKMALCFGATSQLFPCDQSCIVLHFCNNPAEGIDYRALLSPFFCGLFIVGLFHLSHLLFASVAHHFLVEVILALPFGVLPLCSNHASPSAPLLYLRPPHHAR